MKNQKTNFDKIKKAAIESLKKPGSAKKPLPKKESDKYSTLYVFRHTETNDNFNRVFSGRRNSRLTPKGIRQAKELAKLLKDKKIDIAIFSDIAKGKSDRAERTLEEVLKYHPETKKEAAKFLVERDYGALTGTSKLKLSKKNPELCLKYRRSWDYPPPNGESLQMVWKNRLQKFCQDLEKKMRREKINIAISCTNNTMRLIRMYFEGLSIEETLIIENPFSDYAAYAVKPFQKKT